MNNDRILGYYVWATIAAGAAVVVYCASRVELASLDLKYVLLSLLTIFLSSRISIAVPNTTGHVTVSDTFIFLVMLLYGREGAVFLAAAEGGYSSLPFRLKSSTVAFNSAIMGGATFVSGTVLEWLFGRLTDLPQSDPRTFVAAICTMAVVQYLANSVLAAVFTALKRGDSFVHTWTKYYLWSSITHLAGASSAGIISRLVAHFGFYYVLLTSPIVVIIYLTYRTYLQNLETSAEQAERAERERMQAHYAQIEKLSALGELASGVAHNFNNTLTGILARAQLLLKSRDFADIERGLNIIIRTAEDGAQTVKRIQDFARQRRDHDFVPIDVDQLMLEVAEITRPRWKDHAEARNVHITLERQINSHATIMGDAGELREVLINMVFNAVDAMPSGGRLTLATRAAGGEVEISVSDTGVGMTEEVRSRVFDPFFTTKGKAGMGLGLSVSYGIIRRHEGTVEVESEVGRGATFRVRLPAATDGAALPAAAASAAQAAVPGPCDLRLLVVDDEDYVRELLRDILEHEGCEVMLAADGHEAISLFEACEFDAVFTDVGLPGMSGWELARYVREKNGGVALAVITGWGDTVSLEEQSASQADWVVPKPFSIDRIVNLVREVARRKAAQEMLALPKR
ncbi:MAG TPA: ATP-binding protein [Pyrinomonadaceae bacterium]|nr:ATP-binding protein [Pyrinomonadaceae bacterium]